METMSRIQASMVSMLLLGACGKLSYVVLGEAASLCHAAICTVPPTEELRTSAINALRSEQFRLGDDAGQVVFNALEGVARNEVSVELLKLILEQMWELHQLDEIESLELTDVVARFVKRFFRQQPE
jgi:hypothetical protein